MKALIDFLGGLKLTGGDRMVKRSPFFRGSGASSGARLLGLEILPFRWDAGMEKAPSWRVWRRL